MSSTTATPTEGAPQFERSQRRVGPVAASTKLYQGLGALAGQHKDWIFSTVLLLFYSQILGVPASYASVVLAIALVIDAISDPMVGALSDSFRSKLGRRHLFMLWAAVPASLSMFALLSPPQGASVAVLTAWLLVFTLTLRISFTFFTVPWHAIAAELSEDYTERTSIVTYRIMVGWIGGILFIFAMYSLIFTPTQNNDNGLLVVENYRAFAYIVPGLMLLWMLSTTLLTRREIRYLPQPTPHVRPPSLLDSWQRIKLALASRNFARLLFTTLLFAGIAGTGQVFDTFMNLYFWDFKPSDLRWFSLTVAGAMISFATVGALQRRYEKQQIVIVTVVLVMLLAMLKVIFRFANIWPANGDPLLLPLLVVHLTVVVYLINLTLIMFASMIADLVDEQELNTGLRQEGVFSSAITFAAKATSGIGLVLGGILLDRVIQFPRGAHPGEVADDTLLALAVTDGIAVNLLYLLPIALLLRYSLTRTRLTQIQQALHRRRTSAPDAPAAEAE